MIEDIRFLNEKDYKREAYRDIINGKLYFNRINSDTNLCEILDSRIFNHWSIMQVPENGSSFIRQTSFTLQSYFYDFSFLISFVNSLTEISFRPRFFFVKVADKMLAKKRDFFLLNMWLFDYNVYDYNVYDPNYYLAYRFVPIKPGQTLSFILPEEI